MEGASGSNEQKQTTEPREVEIASVTANHRQLVMDQLGVYFPDFAPVALEKLLDSCGWDFELAAHTLSTSEDPEFWAWYDCVPSAAFLRSLFDSMTFSTLKLRETTTWQDTRHMAITTAAAATATTATGPAGL